MQNIDILTKLKWRLLLFSWICNFTVQSFLTLCSSQNYSDYKTISLPFFSSHLFKDSFVVVFFSIEMLHITHQQCEIQHSRACFPCCISPQMTTRLYPFFKVYPSLPSSRWFLPLSSGWTCPVTRMVMDGWMLLNGSCTTAQETSWGGGWSS